MYRESQVSEVDKLLREVLSLAEETKKRDVSSELGGRVSVSMKIDTSLGQSDEKIDGSPKNTTDSPYLDYRKTLETKKVENSLDPAGQSVKYVRGVGDLLDTMRRQGRVPK